MTTAKDRLSRDAEQLEAGAEAMAQSLAIFFNTLVVSGLTREEALHLTQAWLVSFSMNGAQGKTDEQ